METKEILTMALTVIVPAIVSILVVLITEKFRTNNLSAEKQIEKDRYTFEDVYWIMQQFFKLLEITYSLVYLVDEILKLYPEINGEKRKNFGEKKTVLELLRQEVCKKLE